MIFGDFNVQHFTAHTGLMGEALFITCLVTANFILLNILIAVVGHEYEEQLKRCQVTWQERMIRAYEKELRRHLAAPPGRLQWYHWCWRVCCRYGRQPAVQGRHEFAMTHYVISRRVVEDLRRNREASLVATGYHDAEQIAALTAALAQLQQQQQQQQHVHSPPDSPSGAAGRPPPAPQGRQARHGSDIGNHFPLSPGGDDASTCSTNSRDTPLPLAHPLPPHGRPDARRPPQQRYALDPHRGGLAQRRSNSAQPPRVPIWQHGGAAAAAGR